MMIQHSQITSSKAKDLNEQNKQREFRENKDNSDNRRNLQKKKKRKTCNILRTKKYRIHKISTKKKKDFLVIKNVIAKVEFFF